MAHIGIIQTQIYAFVPTNLGDEVLNETWVDKKGEHRKTQERDIKCLFDVKNFKYHQILIRNSTHWISQLSILKSHFTFQNFEHSKGLVSHFVLDNDQHSKDILKNSEGKV